MEAIEWAVEHGAQVINMSLAFSEGYEPSPLLTAAIAVAREEGVVMVGAAGNEGGGYTAYPAAFADVIAVGAAVELKPEKSDDLKAEPASYSNASAALDLMLPGGSHDLDRDANGIVDALVSMTFTPGEPLDFGYWLTSGTSGAAAQASGIAAMLLEVGDHAEDVRIRLVQHSRHLEGHEDFDARGGNGRVRAGQAVEAATKDAVKQECRDGVVYASAMVAITRPAPGLRRAEFYIEVLNEDLEPAKSGLLFGRASGSTNEQLDTKCTDKGICVLMTSAVPWDPSVGVGWSLELETIFQDVGGCGKLNLRPLAFTRIDETAYRLAFDFASGLSAKALLLVLDTTAAADLHNDFEVADYVETYIHRPLGTGMAESSLVAGYDHEFLANNELLERSIVLRTFGTGMAESSIIFDEGFLHESLLDDYGQRELIVRGDLSGAGMAESSIILDGDELAFDFYFDQLSDDRRIITLHHGSGAVSSAVVFDGGLFNPALFETDIAWTDAPPPFVGGTGMAESSRVFDFSAGHLEHLGFAHEPLEDWFIGGVGMAESSLVLDQNLWANLSFPLFDWFGGMGMAESSLIASWSPLNLWVLTVADGFAEPSQGLGADTTPLY